jgi:hypothetical protein
LFKAGDLVRLFSYEHEECGITSSTFMLPMYDEWLSINSVSYEHLSYRCDRLVIIDASLIQSGGNGVRVLTTTGKIGWVHSYTLKRV